MHNIVDIILGLVEWMGYTWIFIMMTIESSFIPFPSEVALLPAWYLAALWEMSLLYIFIAATLGAILWASINYFLGMYLWKPIVMSLVHKYGKYILLSEKHYIQAETYFEKHGAITTLVGRFIPAVRQLISIPAGIFRMSYGKFIFFTALWAGTWNIILIAIWYIAWKNDELVKRLLSESFLVLVVILWTIVAAYVYYVKRHKRELREIEETIEHNDQVLAKKALKKSKK